ncbi:hypothetical protein TFKS16_2438 [Tannerella forsythia KS16]|uniref:Uncharacterized protein n=1 Tax=Tannerella forsythia (strain ATCC 43037 / JCM 10827 / CCUG 21028 A / KCTC 5666 / FDC 338) TaxID=203275 RepID=G8UMB4_TANFA|nr:hypothetical protein BFO_2710 [Tannerella forsythia 92A2]BAR52625.1 hypothetical protein TFKS16_2438 [Tannerella forsythia KS16]
MVGRYRLFMNLGYEGISPEVCKKKIESELSVVSEDGSNFR